MPHRPRCGRRGDHRPRAGHRDLRARRRPQRRRPGRHRRRPDDRPRADEGHQSGPAQADRLGAGRRHLERIQPGRGLPRAGHHRRGRLHHGHRRADPRRRRGLADGQVRPHHRQPAGGGGRHRGRGGRHRERRGKPGPVLGTARRRRQLRGRHLLRVPGPPGINRLRRPGRPPRQPGARGTRLLPRAHPGGPRRTHRVLLPVRRPQRTRGETRRHDRLPLRRRPRGRRNGPETTAAIRAASRRPHPAHALPGDQHPQRRRVPRKERSTTGNRPSSATCPTHRWRSWSMRSTAARRP